MIELLKELALLLFRGKKYWLLPVLIALLLVAWTLALAGSPVAPFIYSLF